MKFSQTHNDWQELKKVLYSNKLLELKDKILPNIDYSPKREDIFRIFSKSLSEIKVIILGQDPYPKKGDAIGRSFATRANRKVPKSLQIIYKEIVNSQAIVDESLVFSEHWKELQHWENQGVFLLNTSLTVPVGNAGGHLSYWKEFTKEVIQLISRDKDSVEN